DFPVPVQLFQNLSEEQEILLAQDHGEASPLSEREMYASMCKLWNLGLSDESVLVRLRTLVEQFSGKVSKLPEPLPVPVNPEGLTESERSSWRSQVQSAFAEMDKDREMAKATSDSHLWALAMSWSRDRGAEIGKRIMESKKG